MENNYYEIAEYVLKTIVNILDGIKRGVDISLHKNSIQTLNRNINKEFVKGTIIGNYLQQLINNLNIINSNFELKKQLDFFYHDLNIELNNFKKKVA